MPRLTFIALLLAGCARPMSPYIQPQTAMDLHQQKCSSIGFERQTDPWRNCVLQLYQQAENKRSQEMMAQRANAMTGAQIIQNAQPRTCNWVGSSVTCY